MLVRRPIRAPVSFTFTRTASDNSDRPAERIEHKLGLAVAVAPDHAPVGAALRLALDLELKVRLKLSRIGRHGDGEPGRIGLDRHLDFARDRLQPVTAPRLNSPPE